MRRRKTYATLIVVTVFVTLVTLSGSGVAGNLTDPESRQITVAASQPVQESSAPSVTPSGAPHAVPSRLPAESVPVIAAPPEEKQKDRVLSQGEVDQQLSKDREEEREPALEKPFFVSALGESGKRDAGLYTGLTGRIDKFIRYFQNSGRSKFELYLMRSGKYADLMRGILSTYGLPGDLIYLALIESGFSPKAYSVASAAGPWQFIVGTGRRYGLRIDWWADERRDYEKSTHAAASYLRDLYGMFDSWPLAAAAYNAGEGKIQRAVTRYRSEDYVELIRYRYLKQETKDYVPKMIAALTIAKEPEKFGFGGVKYEDPLVFDKANVPGGTDLQELGRLIGVPYESLREWNPELRRFCTPPNRESYEIRLPSGYGTIVEEQMEEIREDARVTFLLHTMKKGETLASLADRYHTTVPILLELNGMKNPKLKRSARLVIPVIGLSEEEAVPGKEVSAEQVETALKRTDDLTRKIRKARLKKGKKSVAPARTGKKEIRHVIRSGDTLSKIAKVYGVTPGQLSARNNLKEGQTLPRGRVLRIPLES